MINAYLASGSSPGQANTSVTAPPAASLCIPAVPLSVIRIGRYLRFNWIDVSAWLHRHSSVGAA